MRRIDHDGGRPVEIRQGLIVDKTGPDAGGIVRYPLHEVLGTPPVPTGYDKRKFTSQMARKGLVGLNEETEVFTRLDRADEEDEMSRPDVSRQGPVRASLPVMKEIPVNPVGDHGDASGVDALEVLQLPLDGPGDGDNVVGGVDRLPESCFKMSHPPRGMPFGEAQRGQVMDGEDAGPGPKGGFEDMIGFPVEVMGAA